MVFFIQKPCLVTHITVRLEMPKQVNEVLLAFCAEDTNLNHHQRSTLQIGESLETVILELGEFKAFAGRIYILEGRSTHHPISGLIPSSIEYTRHLTNLR
jgi:hypothetical protein